MRGRVFQWIIFAVLVVNLAVQVCVTTALGRLQGDYADLARSYAERDRVLLDELTRLRRLLPTGQPRP